MNTSTPTPSAWTMLESDNEVGYLLQDRLRIASGITAIPHKYGAAIIGGPSAELFSGHGLRGILSSILPLLDGTRTVAEIEQICDSLDPRQIRDIVGNFFMSGLLRTGVAPDSTSQIEIYLDRLVGNTGVFRSGLDAADRLRKCKIAIFGPAETCDELTSLFTEMEGGEAVSISDEEGLVSRTDLLLAISRPGSADPSSVFARANQLGIPALNVEVGGANARIGPFILPQMSASYACYRVAYTPIVADTTTLEPFAERIWSTMALHMAVSILTSIIKRSPINSFTDYEWKHGRQVQRRTTIARLHEWDEFGNAHPLPLKPAVSGYEGWKQYCSVALQSPDWHVANSYLTHFKTENILSIYERVPALYSDTPINLLPIKTAVEEVTHERTQGVSLAALSILATYTAGFTDRDGIMQRLVPTGGNLGSTLCMYLVFDVNGMEPGTYWFDSHSHRFEKMANIDPVGVRKILGLDASLPVIMISFANVLKVARKYGAFSFNIGWYDSGVLLSFANHLSDKLGLDLTDCRRPDEHQLMQKLGLPGDTLLPTGIFSISSDNVSRTKPIDKKTLDDILAKIERRRAVREWDAEDVPMDFAQSLCSSIQNALVRNSRIAGLNLDISGLLLLKLSDGEDGFYECLSDGKLRLITPFQRQQHSRILSQIRLTEAPVIFLPRIDLAACLIADGDDGVETAYRAAGAVIGDLWLHSESLGLAGTACGGTFEGEVRSITKRHSLEHFAPLSLCLGPVGRQSPARGGVTA